MDRIVFLCDGLGGADAGIRSGGQEKKIVDAVGGIYSGGSQ